MSEKKRKFLLPILVLLVGVVAAVLIISSRKAPPRVERPQLGPLVEVVQAELETVPITVMGHGEVVAKIAVDVVPQVAGRVVKVHPSLVAGGFFGAKEQKAQNGNCVAEVQLLVRVHITAAECGRYRTLAHFVSANVYASTTGSAVALNVEYRRAL